MAGIKWKKGRAPRDGYESASPVGHYYVSPRDAHGQVWRGRDGGRKWCVELPDGRKILVKDHFRGKELANEDFQARTRVSPP